MIACSSMHYQLVMNIITVLSTHFNTSKINLQYDSFCSMSLVLRLLQLQNNWYWSKFNRKIYEVLHSMIYINVLSSNEEIVYHQRRKINNFTFYLLKITWRKMISILKKIVVWRVQRDLEMIYQSSNPFYLKKTLV